MASPDAVSMRSPGVLTRRKLVTSGLALGALSLLAACGGSATPTSTPAASAAPSAVAAASSVPSTAVASAASSAPASAAAAATPTLAATRPAATPSAAGAASPTVGATGGTRTIETANGPVAVPSNPQRIVCVNYIATWNMLDLGLTPLGTGDYTAVLMPTVYVQAWPALPKVGTLSEPDIEKVAALRPDLILGVNTPGYKAPYDNLKGIAPTVAFVAQSSLANWDQLVEQFADAVNRPAQLAALKQQYRDRAATIKSTYAAVSAKYKWALISGQPNGQFYVIHDRASPARIMGDAGAQYIAAAVGKEGSWTSYSHEQLNVLAEADAIAVQATNDGKFTAETQAVLDLPTFKALKAVAAGRVFPMANFFPGSYKIAFELVNQTDAAFKKLQSMG